MAKNRALGVTLIIIQHVTINRIPRGWRLHREPASPPNTRTAFINAHRGAAKATRRSAVIQFRGSQRNTMLLEETWAQERRGCCRLFQSAREESESLVRWLEVVWIFPGWEWESILVALCVCVFKSTMKSGDWVVTQSKLWFQLLMTLHLFETENNVFGNYLVANVINCLILSNYDLITSFRVITILSLGYWQSRLKVYRLRTSTAFQRSLLAGEHAELKWRRGPGKDERHWRNKRRMQISGDGQHTKMKCRPLFLITSLSFGRSYFMIICRAFNILTFDGGGSMW